PFAGVLYVFRNRTSTKLKILFWENNGFVLYYKSLAEEKFHWPSSADELLTITGEQLNFLLDGYDISRMKPHKALRYESVC
ncbi:IS66 family insertion sequence element accessory protein TnpB, partial [Granulosicoccus sp.]